MSAATPIVKELTNYIGKMNKQQQKALLLVVKSFSVEEDKWDDKAYIAEMDRRFTELESGKVKGLSLDELESRARLSFKNRKQGK